jgi:quinol monooxygenase YgiN
MREIKVIARIYSLRPKADLALAARDELRALAAVVGACPGCVDAQALVDAGDGGRLVFIERWASQDAYDGAKSHLPPNAFAGLGKTLAAPPEVTVLEGL